MKFKIIYYSLFLFSIVGFSQQYKPLLDTYNEWQFTNCHFGCNTDVYFTDGDTVVDNKTYKILDGYHYISRTFLLREDLATKKVYIKFTNKIDTNEYLLYDFGLNEGQLFEMKNPFTPFPRDAGSFILDSIRSRPLLDGNDYRHFYFSPSIFNTTSTNNAFWVEGIGSLSLINAPSGEPNINAVGHLSCFFKNGELFYSNLDSIKGCEPVLNIIDLKNELDKLFVITDKAAHKVTILNTSSVVSYEVYTVLGKKVFSGVNISKAQNISFHVSTLSKGLYTIRVKGKKADYKNIKFVL